MWEVDESGPWLSRFGVCILTPYGYNVLFNTISFSGINYADRSLARQVIISDLHPLLGRLAWTQNFCCQILVGAITVR